MPSLSTTPRERLWNRNYLRVMVANFALFFAFYVLTPLLPIYLSETFHATKDIIGLVLSGYTLTALLCRPFSGFLVDSFNRKTVLMVCFALFFVFFFGYIAASTLLLFTIVRTLHGGPFGALTVANSTVAIDVLPASRRNEGVGFYGLSNNLAMAIAPSVGIYIYHLTANFELLFWIASVVAGLGMVVDATVRVPQKAVVRNRSKLSLDRFFLVRGWLLGFNAVFFGFCFGVLSNYLAIYSKEALGMTDGSGTYFLLLSCGLILSRLQGSKSLRNGRLVHNAVAGSLISLCGYTLFAATPNALGYYLSALLIGLGNGHLWPALLNMIIDIARHDERGTANSTLLVTWDVGVGLGVLVGGVLSQWVGYRATFATVAAVNVVGVAILFFFTRGFYLRRGRSVTAAAQS